MPNPVPLAAVPRRRRFDATARHRPAPDHRFPRLCSVSPFEILTPIAFALVLLLPSLALAAPDPDARRSVAVRPALAGTYTVTGSVFGTGNDGQVGGATSSGHIVQPNDHLVALPACTDSSCPWVPDGTGPSGADGPQTACAESDGQCWVQVVSPDTGLCTVAPVLDRGPLFVKDNWWAPTSQRTYPLPQGEPAAVAAAQGQNLGFGPGISDVGLDIEHVYTYAAGIDLAAGTWSDIGLAVGQGVATIQVTMLWQAGIDHGSACGGHPSGGGGSSGSGNGTGNGTGTGTGTGNGTGSGNGGSGTGNATVTSALNLRSGPGTSYSVLTVMPAGASVTLTGQSQNGFLSVNYQGTDGWAYADYLDTGGGAGNGTGSGSGSGNGAGNGSGNGSSSGSGSGSGGETGTATVTSALNLRAGPSTSDSVVTVMPAGATVTLTGQSQNGFVSVTYQGTDGWAYAAYLDTSGAANSGSGSGASGSGTGAGSGNGSGSGDSTGNGSGSGNGTGSGSSGETATTTSSLNLRSGPGTSYSVLDVLPSGATVTITGDAQNGFYPVSYSGESGYVSGTYLDIGGIPSASGGSPTPPPSSGGTATATTNLNLRAGPSTSDQVLLVIPSGATVTLQGGSQNGYESVSYNGTQGWAYAAYLS